MENSISFSRHQPDRAHLRVFLAVDEELHLLLAHLLAQPSEEMPELHSRDQTVALLVKMLQSLIITYKVQ